MKTKHGRLISLIPNHIDKSLTDRECMIRFDASMNTVRKVRRGGLPSNQVLANICDALELQPGDLLMFVVSE